MASVLLFVFFLLSHFVLLLPAQGKMIYTERCPPFRCGHLGEIHFPFANEKNPDCGVFTVDCRDDKHPTIQLAANQEEDGERRPRVLNISQNNAMSSIRIVDIESGEKLKIDRCEFLTNLTLTNSSFISFEIATPNQTFFKCDGTPDIHPTTNFKEMSCNYSNFHSRISSDNLPTYLSECSIIHPPSPGDDDLFSYLAVEFDLGVRVSEDCYKCYRRGGQCKGKPDDKGKLSCYGREKGIDLRITKQYLGIHAYIHENAYKFVSFYVVFIHNSTCAAIVSVPCHNPLL